jgi:TolB-like protein/tetratricopeptide (TPR) repeat protein
MRAVAEALDLAPVARAEWLAVRLADRAEREAAERLLRACERAAESPVLDTPAAQLAAPILTEVEELERADPEALGAALAGRYSIQRELGRGGQATVYLASDERHNRSVALKVLHAAMFADVGPARKASRFQREIELAARLAHPHILPLYDSGAAAGRLFYVTPYVDGQSLRDRLAEGVRLPLDSVLLVLRDVARALSYAHRQGVIHRDIKPANILITRDGDALVSDFGVAKALAAATGSADTPDVDLTDGALVIGTPAYMAPEQAVGSPTIDHRADLYALGIVAYELFTGATPFAGRSRQELLAAHLSEPPAPVAADHPEVPAALADLVDRLLAKRPDDRPRDAAEVLQALDSAVASPHARRRTPSTRRSWLAAGVAVGLLVLAGAVASVVPGRQTRVPAAAGPSIVVLPFVTASSSLGDRAFTDGLTDELIRALGKVPGMQVTPSATASALQRQALGVKAIGARLGVEAILDGGVRREGERFMVTASLIAARDSQVLWSDRYEVSPGDPFAVQERIAREVVAALAPRSGDGALPARLVEWGTANPEAYELYQKGRYLFSMRQRDALFSALQYFERAVALDTAYARAYAGIADAYSLLGVFGHLRPHEAFPKGRAAAERAIALDSLLAEAHAMLAHQLFVYEWNWQAAGPAFERAIALDPRYPLGRMYYASYLHSIGRPEEALAQLAVAQTLDPLNPTAVLSGRVYVDTHRPDEALRILRELVELDPRRDLGHELLAHAFLQKRMSGEAIASMQRAAALSGARDSAQLAYIYAASGDKAEARHVLSRLLQSRSRLDLLGFHLGMAYAGLGEADEAFRWLEAAYRERGGFMNLLAVSSGFEAVRSDPRFAGLLRRMGLAYPPAKSPS